jgi:hypothetical protein
MKIKLSCIETYILTIENNFRRYDRLKNELNCLEDKLKINVFYGKTITGYLGCAISTVNMYKSISPPVLCLEDDCGLTENYNNELEIPDDADAVYLGTSVWGVTNGQADWGNFTIKKYNDKFYKIEGMCSAHAVLFLNNNFLGHLNKIGESYNMESTVPFDYLMCQEQSKFNVYGVTKPMFYQKGDTNEEVTLYSLDQVYKNKNLVV